MENIRRRGATHDQLKQPWLNLNLKCNVLKISCLLLSVTLTIVRLQLLYIWRGVLSTSLCKKALIHYAISKVITKLLAHKCSAWSRQYNFKARLLRMRFLIPLGTNQTKNKNFKFETNQYSLHS